MKAWFQQRRHKHVAKATQRWAQPIGGLPRRVRAWLSLLLADHGFLRPVYWNSGKVGTKIWRGPQPNPFHLRRLARSGLKTIVNLRGSTVYGSYALEKEGAQKLGLTLIDLPLSSGSAPLKKHIYDLRDVFQKMQTPALLHCKSGSDRSGLAAALYLILQENVPVAEAAQQLSRRYGHIRASKTGILDAFFAQYLADTSRKPMPFLQWVEEVYDSQKLNAEFSKPNMRQMLIDFIIRRE